MTTPTWNQIAAPNFSAGNYLIAQAMEQLDKATTGFKSIADQYKDTIQKRNLGLIQEYVNSAKTPEELQSEAFKTGLDNRIKAMGGEYDTLAKAQLVDKAYDSLLSRKANQVSIASNEFNLDTAKKTQLTKDYTNKILAAPPEQRDALRQAAINAGAFDFGGVTAGDLAVAQLLGTTQQNKLRDATWDDQVKAFKLANNKTQADIDDIKTNNDIAWYNALTQRAQATAAKNDKGFTVAQGEEALDGIFKDIRDNQSKVLLDIKTKYPYKDMAEVDKEISKTQWASFWRPATAVKAKGIISNSPTLSKLPPNVQAAIYKGIVDRVSENNIAGKFDWVSQDDKTYKKYALDSAKSVLGYLYNANSIEKSLIQDGANKLMRMSNGGGGKPVTFEEARDYLNKQLGNSPLSEYQIDSLTLEALNAEEKQKDDKVVKTGDSYLPEGGFGLQLGGNMVVTQNPVAAQAQPKSIDKAATAEAKEVKQSTFIDTPLKVLANAVKPVPSPLIPVESQNAYKVKENNLSINLSTGKSVPSKDPVPMPNVSWGKPAEVVTMNPIFAKLPQYKAVATFVEDGDTFSAKSDSYATKGEKAKKAGGILCRVDSVDAPETPHLPYKRGQPYGEEAAKKLQQMILNKEISIRIVKPANGDPNEPGLYGRDICQIEVSGANVSTELIRAGAAWLYREYNYYFTGLETVEANAKAEGRGLFSNPNAVYPQTAKHSGSLNLR